MVGVPGECKAYLEFGQTFLCSQASEASEIVPELRKQEVYMCRGLWKICQCLEPILEYPMSVLCPPMWYRRLFPLCKSLATDLVYAGSEVNLNVKLNLALADPCMCVEGFGEQAQTLWRIKGEQYAGSDQCQHFLCDLCHLCDFSAKECALAARRYSIDIELMDAVYRYLRPIVADCDVGPFLLFRLIRED